MYDSDSDLTEDEEFKPTTSTRSKKSGSSTKKPGGYRIQNVLKVPRPTTYTTQALYEQIHSSDINLEPEYQREIVWPETKQIGLIDSIFRNFYIPPVIFAVNQYDDGAETKTCIDGKQRLTSIYRFMDGLICHKDPFTNEKLWYKDVGSGKGPKKKILPEKYRRLFANKQIVCIEYQDITDDDEREIFQRVQLGMALTPAEKLQSIIGPMPSFVRELVSTYLTEGGLAGHSLDWDRSRGGDFRCLSQALFVIDKYGDKLTNHGTILQLEKWLQRAPEPTPEFREKVYNTFNVFVDLVQDPSLSEVFSKPTKVSPIEFILIAVLIAVHKDKLTPAQLSEAISDLREDARNKHDDIRMNSRVSRTMVEFIKKLQVPRGKARDAAESAGALAKAATKRKRDTRDEGRDVKMKSPPLDADNTSQETRVTRQNPAPDPYISNGPVPPAKPKAPSSTDRLAAIRAAKDKLLPAPLSIPPLRAPSALSAAYSPTLKPKIESPLENGLMARMNSSWSVSGSHAPDLLSNAADRVSRSRYSPSRAGSRSRSKSRGKDRDADHGNERDRGRRRSVSSERSPTRPHKPYDGTRNWDYKSQRGRDREHRV